MMSRRMFAGMSLLPTTLVDHRIDIALRQPIDREGSDVRPSNPRRLKFRAVCNDQQHAKGSYPLYGSTKRFEACRINPMYVLEDHQDRMLGCQSRKLCGQRFQRSLSALLWGSSSAG